MLGGPNFFRIAWHTHHSKEFFNLITEHIFILKSVEKPLITSWSKIGPKIVFFADYDQTRRSPISKILPQGFFCLPDNFCNLFSLHVAPICQNGKFWPIFWFACDKWFLNRFQNEDVFCNQVEKLFRMRGTYRKSKKIGPPYCPYHQDS